MTLIEPRASLATSRKAARMLRFDRRSEARTSIETTLPTSPTTPKATSIVDGISGGLRNRPIASTTT
jgi:hypothetical protein